MTTMLGPGAGPAPRPGVGRGRSDIAPVRRPQARGHRDPRPNPASNPHRTPAPAPAAAPGPVIPVTFDGTRHAWLVLGYRELHYVLSSPEIFTSDPRNRARRENIPADWAPLPGLGRRPSLLHTDSEDHQRRYQAVNDVLGEVDVFLLRARAEAITDSVIDDFAGLGSADLVASFAHQVPALVLASLCGPDDLDATQIAEDLVDLVDIDADAARGHRHLVARLRDLLAIRLDEPPTEDIISGLIDHPAELTDDEIVEDLAVALGFGMRTVAGWIGNSLRLLLTDGSFALELSGGRRSVMQALTRVLWEDTPLQITAGRWATRDIQLGGQRIRAGEMVALGLAAANSDPRVRRDHASGPPAGCGAALAHHHNPGGGPALRGTAHHAGNATGADADADADGTVTASGPNSAHLSFGHGAHRCPFPAQEIAEVITRTAVEVLLDRLPNVRLAVPAGALAWRRTAWNRALTALPVRFSPV
ncbi:Cytochrome P450 [Parafrankia irregularis]|uniref:Cytochrome P450 n=1 Tax=Parafrankia irregularis TaxID=795642 RepID=A0A0S4QWT0_9ACTN|nr:MULTISPECIES: cytochrome P450 [Parafrankia]MBE3202407.1 cytochrome P450 [Parafrankia sp. CH37]CUU58922.1 Cytochrome P450 [Parafrankia irregularis]